MPQIKIEIEQVRPRHNASFNARTYATRQFKVSYHIHEEYELVQINSGTGTRMVGDHLGRFKTGDLLLIAARMPHLFMGDHNPEETPRDRSSVIQFRRDAFGEGFFDIPEMRGVQDLLSRSERGVAFGAEITRRAQPLLVELTETKMRHPISGLVELLDLLAQSSDYCFIANPGVSVLMREKDSVRIEAVCTHVQEHFAEPIRLDDVAPLAGLSPSGFSRFFHQRTGIPFTTFIKTIRLEHASQRLLQTDQTILEVALESGFTNLSNFNRQFKETYSVTPRQYRNGALINIRRSTQCGRT